MLDKMALENFQKENVFVFLFIFKSFPIPRQNIITILLSNAL